jgi:hypothetical protein
MAIIRAGFKALTMLSNGRKQSYMNLDEERTVNYKLHEWATPLQDCGPLCVFDSLAEVTAFIIEDYHGVPIPKEVVIYECQYEVSISQSVWSSSQRGNSSSCPLKWMPDNTILADRVMLIKRARFNKRNVNRGK